MSDFIELTQGDDVVYTINLDHVVILERSKEVTKLAVLTPDPIILEPNESYQEIRDKIRQAQKGG